MSKYQLSFEANSWECGDGCCNGDETKISVNGIEIGWYSDLSMRDLDGIKKFISVLNKNDHNLTLEYKAEIDEDEGLIDVIYLNEAKITTSFWCSQMYSDILDKLNLKYRCLTYDLDWDVWTKEKKLTLVLDEDEIRNQ